MSGIVSDEFVPDELRLEAIEAAEDRIALLNAYLRECRSGELSLRDGLVSIRQMTHSLKGLGASYGSRALSQLTHRLEDYLASLDQLTPQALADTQCFVDRFAEAVEDYFDADESEVQALLARLPECSAGRAG